ncbi:inverse autotransporter beta domain-containing protein [Morganella morganii]|uniref:inverse autotransporter beta domain-containing protein n=1 Tax=Morganella morganii TaxID=582 RepID=UPI0021D21C8D|nr:inverse autotransporter beta domain-containing protein [Morganella morganii]MCU6274017.1 inverse autotransporter beta domain-containing protein [Morganella morganii]
MKPNLTPFARWLTWALVGTQVLTPVALAQGVLTSSAGADADSATASDLQQQHEQWLASQASGLGGVLQDGSVSDYARSRLMAVPQSVANEGLGLGVKTLLPEAQFRGGITLEDGTKYRSAEADLLIPLHQSTSSILFGQFGMRDHDSGSFNGRTFVNMGIGWRQDAGTWLLGVNGFLDADVKHNHLRGSLGLEASSDTISFSGNGYFPLTGWKESKVLELHDERPATGFDLRAKGSLPSLPWFGAELAYEQYFGDKVDILGNDTLTRNPSAISGALSWRPVPLIEIKSGYKDAGSGGSQAEVGLNLNYTFGVPLSDQLNPSLVRPATNSSNRTAFVDRNYNIVMEYREQSGRISIHASSVSGMAGQTVVLNAGISSRYPIERIEWRGDAALMAGLQQPGSINSPLTLPELPLDVTDSKEYGLYLTVTDIKGNTATSERIPVLVSVNPESFRSHLNVIHDEVRREDGIFVVPSPTVNDPKGTVVEWHYVRERSKEEWTSLKPDNIEYKSDSPGLTFKSMGGEERDGHWVERVQVMVNEPLGRAALTPVDLHIIASGPGGIQPVKGTVRMTPEVNLTQKVSAVEVVFIPGTEELNGSTTAPVVGTTLQAKTTCDTDTDCTDQFRYQWEVSPDNRSWYAVPGAMDKQWLMPTVLNGQSLQNRHVRVRVASEINGEQP